MRNLVLFCLLLISFYSSAQLSDRTEAQRFWDSNVQAIIKMDVGQILKQTKFPLPCTGPSLKLTEAQFKSAIGTYFTDEIRKTLETNTIDFIDAFAFGDDQYEKYMLTFPSPSNDNEAVVFIFSRINDNWFLTGINKYSE